MNRKIGSINGRKIDVLLERKVRFNTKNIQNLIEMLWIVDNNEPKKPINKPNLWSMSCLFPILGDEIDEKVKLDVSYRAYFKPIEESNIVRRHKSLVQTHSHLRRDSGRLFVSWAKQTKNWYIQSGNQQLIGCFYCHSKRLWTPMKVWEHSKIC